MLTHTYHIRPAVAADQPVIRRLVRAAQINPLGLHWPRFQLALLADEIIGTVQVKPHRDGTRELASLAVLPAHQGRGVAQALVRTVQASETAPLYLTCADRLEGFYNRLDFRRVPPAELPPDLGRMYVLVNILIGLTRQPNRLLIMRWDGPTPA